jgi:hypothetical protein
MTPVNMFALPVDGICEGTQKPDIFQAKEESYELKHEFSKLMKHFVSIHVQHSSKQDI